MMVCLSYLKFQIKYLILRSWLIENSMLMPHVPDNYFVCSDYALHTIGMDYAGPLLVCDIYTNDLATSNSMHTVQAVRNITLISQKRTKTKSCEFVRTFSKISEFAN